MNKEIVTDPLSIEDLWLDLRENVKLLDRIPIAKVNCLFGFSWGKFIYADKWHEIPLAANEVEARVLQYEKEGYGRLGDDNLYIAIAELDIKVAYTYETDIHLSYSTDNHLVREIIDRWDSAQWLARGQYR